VELLGKLKGWALELKSKMSTTFEEEFFRGESYITFDQAVKILQDELGYPEERAIHYVRRFDKNKDGKLSMQEFSIFKHKIEETKTKIVPKFKEYDKDGNGFITVEEASSILQRDPFNFPAQKVVLLLRQFDKDGNGKLDIEEFGSFYAEAKATHEEIAAKFDELDKDGNGVLSPDEVVTVIQEYMGFDERMAHTMIQMFDQNQDGSLDKTEFMQLWTSMFGEGEGQHGQQQVPRL